MIMRTCFFKHDFFFRIMYSSNFNDGGIVCLGNVPSTFKE